MTFRRAAFAVLLFATSGVVEAADGGVQEHRRSGVPGRAPGALLGPLPAAGDTGSAEADGRYPLTARPDGGASYDSPQFSATVAPDGTVTFHDHRLRYARRDAALNFDLSDEFSRELTHGTLYRHEKANFLAATFRRRTDMAARAYAVRMRAALEELPARLDALWADTRYHRRERRRIIFLLWAEADRSGLSVVRPTRSSKAGSDGAFRRDLRTPTASPRWRLCHAKGPGFRRSPRMGLSSRCARRNSTATRRHGRFPFPPENFPTRPRRGGTPARLRSARGMLTIHRGSKWAATSHGAAIRLEG